MPKAKLGDKVQDRASGLEGIVVGEHRALLGATRLAVQAKVTADGKLPEQAWFDEDMLAVVANGVIDPSGG